MTEPDFHVRPFEPSDAEMSARAMAGSEPWITLGRSYEACLAIMRDPAREKWIGMAGSEYAGTLILSMTGALVGYIQSIFILPHFRGHGIGSEMLLFAEKRIFKESPNVFLSVSSFNAKARALYERRGYRVVGELRDYLVRGHSEILMRKTIGPIKEFREGRLQAGTEEETVRRHDPKS